MVARVTSNFSPNIYTGRFNKPKDFRCVIVRNFPWILNPQLLNTKFHKSNNFLHSWQSQKVMHKFQIINLNVLNFLLFSVVVSLLLPTLNQNKDPSTQENNKENKTNRLYKQLPIKGNNTKQDKKTKKRNRTTILTNYTQDTTRQIKPRKRPKDTCICIFP